MVAIEVRNLKKYFDKVKAVDDVSFSVEKGEVFGFLGPNGAGKTTTIRCFMDFISPISGSISLLTKDPHKDSVFLKKEIGYLPADSHLYTEWTGKEHIDFVALAKRITDRKTIDSLVERLNFDTSAKVKHLSSGNKQKLAVILALIADPKLLILDEPTQGLDPIVQNEFYEILRNFQSQGGTVFMSSHNLPEVERICSRVGIIKDGKLITVETIQSIREKSVHSVYVSFFEEIDVNEFKIEGVEVHGHNKDLSEFTFRVKGDLNLLISRISQHKFRDLEVTHASLEEIFLEFYR